MPLSREDAGKIGKEAADKVIKSAQACRCGLAVWDTRTNIASIEAVILHQQADWIPSISRLQQDTLTIVERHCGVSMTEAKELSARLENNIKKRDWQEARLDLNLLRGAIQSRLVECAAEGSNPGGQHVKIEDPGKTTFNPGETISKEAFDKENERVRKLGEKPATGAEKLGFSFDGDSLAEATSFVNKELGTSLKPELEIEKEPTTEYVAIRSPGQEKITAHPKFFPSDIPGQKTVLIHEISEIAFEKMRAPEPHEKASDFTQSHWGEAGGRAPKSIHEELVRKGYYH